MYKVLSLAFSVKDFSPWSDHPINVVLGPALKLTAWTDMGNQSYLIYSKQEDEIRKDLKKHPSKVHPRASFLQPGLTF